MTTPRAATGITGLDTILGGGLPVKQAYLVQGKPGTGKTTVGLQFLLEGVKKGERGLYITLSESAWELREVARSHGWNLDGIHIHEYSASDAAERLAAEQTLFHSADVELGEISDAILSIIDEIRPERAVFDSIAEIRLLADTPLRYRRQMLKLKHRMSERGCTVMFMDNEFAGNSDKNLQDLVHGVIELEQLALDYGNTRRRLQIIKMRGMSYHEGYHDFRIYTGGFEVYPRIKIADSDSHNHWDSLQSGIGVLDSMVGGGLEEGTAALIVGASGTGKTILASLYAQAAAERGENVGIFIFDERLETFYRRSDELGIDISGSVAAGCIHMQQVNTGEVSPGEFAYRLQSLVEKEDIRVVVLDSLTGYMNAMPQERLLVTQMHELLMWLSQRGVLTLLTLTQHGFIGNVSSDPIDLSYLADSVIVLKHFESRGTLRKAIAVIKKRHGSHERSVRELLLEPGSIRLSEPLADFAGILSGFPQLNGTSVRKSSENERDAE